LFVAFVAASAFGAGREAVPLEAKGFQLGGSRAQLQERFPFLRCDADTCSYYLTTCDIEKQRRCGALADDFMIGEIPISWLVTLKDDRVTQIVFIAGAMNFDDLMLALVAKFGKPTRSTVGVVQNGFGAKFDSRTVTWNRGGGQVLAVQRFGNLAQSAVMFLTPEAAKQQTLDALRRASKAASGL
jgi:hypothetical protein